MPAGKVLKDDDKIEAYKIQNGHTIHMVKGAAKPAEAAPTPQRLPQMGTGLSAGNMADTIENYHHVCCRRASRVEWLTEAGPRWLQPVPGHGHRKPAGPQRRECGAIVRGNLTANLQMTGLMNNPEFLRQMSDLMSRPEVVDQVSVI